MDDVKDALERHKLVLYIVSVLCVAMAVYGIYLSNSHLALEKRIWNACDYNCVYMPPEYNNCTLHCYNFYASERYQRESILKGKLSRESINYIGDSTQVRLDVGGGFLDGGNLTYEDDLGEYGYQRKDPIA